MNLFAGKRAHERLAATRVRWGSFKTYKEEQAGKLEEVMVI